MTEDASDPCPGSPLPLLGGGRRYDGGKVRLDLIPPEWIWGLGVVLTKGANKYADRNWELGMPWSKVWGPLLRHSFKWLMGEQFDKETGCHHLDMVAWNALALKTYQTKGLGIPDLPAWSASGPQDEKYGDPSTD